MSKMKENNTNDWVDFLPNIQYIMNINMQNSTKTTPYDIVFVKSPNLGLSGVFDGGNEEVLDQEEAADNEEIVDHEEVVETEQVLDTELLIEEEATTSKLTRRTFLTQVITKRTKIKQKQKFYLNGKVI